MLDKIIMKYPLEEKIGVPDLLVGRKKEFRNFDKWIANIPKKLSKSRVILARRKSGKTSFIQRIFNKLWSDNGSVIPFYFDIAESKIWYPTFAIKYYRAFASQYISFLERDPALIREPLTLQQIREYGVAKSIKPLIHNVDSLFQDRDAGYHDLVWETAYSAPHRFADQFNQRILVILDEFQNITRYVYPDKHYQTSPIETLAGSFHYHVESKIAPMLVTGSYIGWLINISNKYLEAGRLSEIYMKSSLSNEEGIQAVYKYCEVYEEPVTNETAVQINRLCMSDPFFISCVIQSNYEGRDLTTEDGVVNTVNYEITDRYSEMSRTWGEYIELTLHKINDKHAKKILLYLSKNAHRYFTPKEIKAVLHLDLDVNEIQRKLLTLVKADVLEWGTADIDFRGLQDGTLNLILRNRFEKEINDFVPDLKQDFHEQIKVLKKDKQRLQGMLNNMSGKFAEVQLAGALRSRKRFLISEFFQGLIKETNRLNIIDVRQRVPFQRKDGKKMEIDVMAESSCGRIILIEVKKTKNKTGINIVEDFFEKKNAYANKYTDHSTDKYTNQNTDKQTDKQTDKKLIPAFLSLGGFTDEAMRFCSNHGIGTAESINNLIVNC